VWWICSIMRFSAVESKRKESPAHVIMSTMYRYETNWLQFWIDMSNFIAVPLSQSQSHFGLYIIVDCWRFHILLWLDHCWLSGTHAIFIMCVVNTELWSEIQRALIKWNLLGHLLDLHTAQCMHILILPLHGSLYCTLILTIRMVLPEGKVNTSNVLHTRVWTFCVHCWTCSV
jgi:hypothetical protein